MELSENQPAKDIKFDNDRKGLVIEVGHGGPATILNKKNAEYLNKKRANYLGVDPDSDTDSSFFNGYYDWAKNLQEDVYDLPHELDGKADEIWMANFKDMGKGTPNSKNLEKKIFGRVFELTKPGGKLVFVNSYDYYKSEQEEQIIDSLERAGFQVKKVDSDDFNKHPFIESNCSPQVNVRPFVVIATKLIGSSSHNLD